MRPWKLASLFALVAAVASGCADVPPTLSAEGVPAAASSGPEVQPFSSLAVSIDGPTLVRRWTNCEWRAVVSGGTRPYTYTWDADGGYGDSYGYYWIGMSISAAMWVTVTVTDANGLQGSHTLYVNTSPSAPTC